MDEKVWIEKLREEGFSDLRVCPVEPVANPGEHTHDQHIIVN